MTTRRSPRPTETSEHGSIAPFLRRVVREHFEAIEAPPPPPAMTTLEKAGAVLLVGAAVGVKFFEERSRVPALPSPAPAPVPARSSTPARVPAAIPSFLSWDLILAFVAPIAAGVAIVHLWRRSARADLESVRLLASLSQLDARQAEFKRLLGALRVEIGGVHQRLAQLERREDGRDTRAAQAERARDQRARQAEVGRDQAARDADARRDRRAEQLEARRSEGYVAALAHNTRELTRVLAEERAKLDKMNDHVEWMQGLRRDAPTPTEARELDKQIVDAKQEVQAIYDDLDYLSSLC